MLLDNGLSKVYGNCSDKQFIEAESNAQKKLAGMWREIDQEQQLVEKTQNMDIFEKTFDILNYKLSFLESNIVILNWN